MPGRIAPASSAFDDTKNYLEKEIARLSFGAPLAGAGTTPPQPAQEPRLSLVAGGAQEPPLPAGAHRRRRVQPLERIRGLNPVGARGFEPPTFCSQIAGRVVTGARNRSQRSRTIGLTIDRLVQRSEVFAPFHRRFTSPVLQRQTPHVRHGDPSPRTRAELDPRRSGRAGNYHRLQARLGMGGTVNKDAKAWPSSMPTP